MAPVSVSKIRASCPFMKLLTQMSVIWAMAIAKHASMVLTGFRPTLRYPKRTSVRHPERDGMLLPFQLGKTEEVVRKFHVEFHVQVTEFGQMSGLVDRFQQHAGRNPARPHFLDVGEPHGAGQPALPIEITCDNRQGALLVHDPFYFLPAPDNPRPDVHDPLPPDWIG